MQCRELQVVIRCDLPNFSSLSIRRRYPSLRLWAAKGALSNRLSARGILSISACGCLHMRLGMASDGQLKKEKGLDVRLPQSQKASIACLAILRRTIHFFITCAWTLLVSFRDTTNFGHFIVLSSALDPPQLSVSQIFWAPCLIGCRHREDPFWSIEYPLLRPNNFEGFVTFLSRNLWLVSNSSSKSSFIQSCFIWSADVPISSQRDTDADQSLQFTHDSLKVDLGRWKSLFIYMCTHENQPGTRECRFEIWFSFSKSHLNQVPWVQTVWSFCMTSLLITFQPPWLSRYFIAWCGVLNMQGNPIWWAMNHTWHHRWAKSELPWFPISEN